MNYAGLRGMLLSVPAAVLVSKLQAPPMVIQPVRRFCLFGFPKEAGHRNPRLSGGAVAAARFPCFAAPGVLPRGRCDMASGTVKWFDAAKGFGFIQQDGGGEDVFAHFSNMAAQGFHVLIAGEQVTFDLAPSRKGLTAENIISV
jgi:CspA family cold shock protein